ncbi:MAG: hypothetical protein M1834_003483 [Cirrosporium novae-zelandiae]|nr:MAG: hypothetical protein M1834_003483 [Cirrosporium novae-zelandiae]
MPSSNQAANVRLLSPIREYARTVEPNPSLVFVFQIHLCMIAQETMRSLYGTDIFSQSWSHVQSTIDNLNHKIEEWKAALPASFQEGSPPDPHLRLSQGLTFFYYSVKMMINRLCLCKMELSEQSKVFKTTAAMQCVQAAQALIKLLPEAPNAVELYSISPWWCVLRYLVQAATVLQLELALGADHMSYGAEVLLTSAKKAVLWLHSLTRDDLAAKRAWKVCHEMLQVVASRTGHRIKGVPEKPLSDIGFSQDEQIGMVGVKFGTNAVQQDISLSNPQQSPMAGPENPKNAFYGGLQSLEPYAFQSSIYTSFDDTLPDRFQTELSSVYLPFD